MGLFLIFGVSSASAKYFYRCYNAATCNGPNETLNSAVVLNESGTGVIGRLWEELFEGYREDGRLTCSECSVLKPSTPGFEDILGHAETERWYMKFTYTLAGEQIIE